MFIGVDGLLCVLVRDGLSIEVAVGLAEVHAILEVGRRRNMIQGNVVRAAFHAIQYFIRGCHDKRWVDVQLAGQHLSQFNLEPRQFALLLETQRGRVGIDSDAQLTTVVYFVDQFGVSQWAQEGC
ncbi:hypothetical protein D3C76_1165100 [compost metagenome]